MKGANDSNGRKLNEENGISLRASRLRIPLMAFLLITLYERTRFFYQSVKASGGIFLKQKNKQVRQATFVSGLRKRISTENPRLGSLTENDLHYLLKVIFEEIALYLQSGHRVIIEGFMSFFTNPVKRKCTDFQTKKEWYSLKRRIRVLPLESMKSIAEVEISEDEYELAKKK